MPSALAISESMCILRSLILLFMDLRAFDHSKSLGFHKKGFFMMAFETFVTKNQPEENDLFPTVSLQRDK